VSITAIDLFAGCGGASIGLRRAGLQVVADYERDADALLTLGAAGLHPVPADLAYLAGADLPAVDLWWASPPCQPFSTAGSHLGDSDERDGYPHLLRLLDEAAQAGRLPRWLLIENVRGLISSRHTAYWADVQAHLRRHFGWVEWRLLDTADYGVPQHRKRVITVCGPVPIAWPEPTHGPGRLLPWVTMGEALGLCDERVVGGGGAGNAGPWIESRSLTSGKHPELCASPDRPSPTVRAGGKGHSPPYLYVQTGDRPAWWHRASPVNEPSRTVGSRANASVLLDGAQGMKPQRRRLTVEECLVLQDLAGHPVQGRTKTSQYRQAGNAVPPRLAEIVAQAVLEVKPPLPR
jgi:DNA (cytosine-5)-methyltransferase 1